MSNSANSGNHGRAQAQGQRSYPASQAGGDDQSGGIVEEIKDETGMYIALAQAKSRYLLACFTATWCRPCQAFAPKLERVARQFSQVIFVKVDVDKMQDMANQYGVQVLPTFVLFKGGYRVASVCGTTDGKIEEMLVNNGAFPIHRC